MIDLTVGELKNLIKDLPDDMDVIIPVTIEEDANYIDSFRHVRTLGIWSNKYEEKFKQPKHGCSITGFFRQQAEYGNP